MDPGAATEVVVGLSVDLLVPCGFNRSAMLGLQEDDELIMFIL